MKRKTMTRHSLNIRYRPVLLGLILVAMLAVMGNFNATGIMAAPPTERDFFGIVVSVGDDAFQVSTEEGIVDVMTSENTMIRLPLKSDALLTDLVEGDTVAVSLDDDLVASKVFVIPGKTQFRHIPGVVTFASDEQITIQPLSEGADPLTFNIGPGTQIKLRSGATELVEGVFAVVLVKRDPLTGELSRHALEVHIAAGKPHVDTGQEAEVTPPEPENVARITGVFEGIDGGGKWIVGETFVLVDADTEIDSGVAVGQLVEVRGELSPNGFLHAHEIETREEARATSRRTRLEGIFEGVNENGSWTVSGTVVIVGEDADTDGLPFVGQRVRVEGLVQENGSIIAREIENRVGFSEKAQDTPQIRLEGTLERIDSDGNWIVNGLKVAVSAATRLEGTPAVGSRVEINAVTAGDRILALEIEGQEEVEDGISQSRNRVELQGIVERIAENGSLIVGRHRIAVNEATEVQGDVVQGASVKVIAFLLKSGQLVAKEIELEEDDDDVIDLANRVSIEGTIERVIQRDTIVVNGITVEISPGLQIETPFVAGARIKVEGILQVDGSVLARRFRVEVRENEVESDDSGPGSLEQDDEATLRYRGVISGFGSGKLELDGESAFTLNRNTSVEGKPVVGAEVTVEATRTSEGLIAVKVEVEEDSSSTPPTRSIEAETETRTYEGTVEGRLLDKLTLEDGTVFLITRATNIKGILSQGVEVEIDALVSPDGTLTAGSVEVEERDDIRSSPDSYGSGLYQY